ncbi:MAG: PilZ domain-containing protein, partial [Nitrospiraceae bacterium]
DISLGGCRVESDTPPAIGTELTLSISLPQEKTPIQVDQATVRWAHGQEFGISFRTLRPEEWERLHYVVSESKAQAE